jgi:hypothetical protein
MASADANISVPLNEQAVLLLGNFGKARDKVFDLHYSAALCSNLNKWAVPCGCVSPDHFWQCKAVFRDGIKKSRCTDRTHFRTARTQAYEEHNKATSICTSCGKSHNKLLTSF